eukprot:Colp12_sorted_trinity150504_noHs@3652
MAKSLRTSVHRLSQLSTPFTAKQPSTQRCFASFYDTKVDEYAHKKPRTVTIKQMLHFGSVMTERKLIESARFIHHELPIRLAYRIKDMQNLPFIVGINPYMKEVYDLYMDAFNCFREFRQIKCMKDEEEFTALVLNMMKHHRVAIPTLAKAAREISKHMTDDDLNAFLDRMLITRISRRLLAEQHIAFHRYFVEKHHNEGFVGIVQQHCKPLDVINKITPRAQAYCRLQYGRAPDVVIAGHVNAEFTYMESHLAFILLELFCNSMYATAKFHASEQVLPPVNITICQSEEFVTIRIADQGGGIEHSEKDKVWNYNYTTRTADKVPAPISMTGTSIALDGFKDSNDGGVDSLAGTGFGLPFARVYSNYFGGSLKFHSMHGYGLDMFLQLKRTKDTMETVLQ